MRYESNRGGDDDDDGVGEDYFVGACIKILNASMKVPKLWLFLF